MIVGKRAARRPLPRFRRAAPRAGEQGEHCPPRWLSTTSVSKATVTRTLRILADEGLVRVVPRWGTFRA